MRKRILLVDDHEILREGLRTLIETKTDMEVLAEADNGRTAIQLARKLKPDLIIMDIIMPDMNGMDAAQQIIADLPDVKIIALSMHSDRRFVLGMLKAGVSGFLLKECAFKELTVAINAAVANQTYLSPKIAHTVIQDYRQHVSDKDLSPFHALTGREREVLQLIAEGRSTREIADDLNVSVKTVEARRRQIMEKLKLNTIADLIKFAIREGLTPP
ncbi:MAG: response regulator transcription factor [Desulfobacterales bacterium]|nr:MAG: response regulator transcription factor [Desulfobacterales bacterium]